MNRKLFHHHILQLFSFFILSFFITACSNEDVPLTDDLDVSISNQLVRQLSGTMWQCTRFDTYPEAVDGQISFLATGKVTSNIPLFPAGSTWEVDSSTLLIHTPNGVYRIGVNIAFDEMNWDGINPLLQFFLAQFQNISNQTDDHGGGIAPA